MLTIFRNDNAGYGGEGQGKPDVLVGGLTIKDKLIEVESKVSGYINSAGFPTGLSIAVLCSTKHHEYRTTLDYIQPKVYLLTTMATTTEAPPATALPDFLLDPNVVLKDGIISSLLYSSHYLLISWIKL